jgi:hypothetical protein
VYTRATARQTRPVHRLVSLCARRVSALASLSVLVALAACGDDDAPPPVDAGPPDAPALCVFDEDCDDGVFCNGAERCARSASAGADGCAPAEVTRCLLLERCLETEQRCEADCARGGDADGDGHAAIPCGGDDCDDGDVDVSPEAPEVCDGEGRDEDCDPSTLAGADGDGDGDGAVRAACCNEQPGGGLRCGEDCADGEAAIRPGATEICNRLDDDCDGRVDEEGATPFYADADRDGYGDAARVVATGCRAPARATADATDCDDGDAAVSPGAREVCDGDDETCDARSDEGCPTGAVRFTSGTAGPGTVGSGTIFHDDRCGDGSALVGLAAAVDVGGVATTVAALCAPLTVVADEAMRPWSYAPDVGVTTRLAERGAAGALLEDARCPAGAVVVSIGPGLTLGCAVLGVERASDGYALLRAPAEGAVGPGGGGPTTAFACPPREVAIGLFGFAGAGALGVDGIRCARPDLALRD